MKTSLQADIKYKGTYNYTYFSFNFEKFNVTKIWLWGNAIQ